jgi:hypothetical protein
MSGEDIFLLGLLTPVPVSQRLRGAACGASTTAAHCKVVAPTPGTSGRGGGVGVSSIVLHVKRLSLVIVKERELGVVLCGGKIGKRSGSMCLKKANECTGCESSKDACTF